MIELFLFKNKQDQLLSMKVSKINKKIRFKAVLTQTHNSRVWVVHTKCFFQIFF